MEPLNNSEFGTGTIEGLIAVPREFFEHLLNCLANQKFINDINADAVSLDTDSQAIQRDCQGTIDKAWLRGMDMLNQFDHPPLPGTLHGV